MKDINNFFHYIDSNNDLYMYGSNNNHALGLDNQDLYVEFSNKIWICGNVKKVSYGASHTAILTINGDLYLMGDNSNNQIGLPVKYVSTPYKIRTGVYDIICNYNSVIHINYNNTIGEYGNLTDLNYSTGTTHYITKRLTPMERYNFISVGKNIRIVGIYNIYDSQQRFLIEGDYLSYEQSGYSLYDFFGRFKKHMIKKVIILDKQIFVLLSDGTVYYYGKENLKIMCSNSGSVVNSNVKDLVISRDYSKLYIVKENGNKFNTDKKNMILSYEIGQVCDAR